MTAGQRDYPTLDSGRKPRKRASVRDHVSDIPVRTRLAANRAHVAASNGWHRAAGKHIQGARAKLSNARNRRAIERGRRDLPRRTADSLRSSPPVVRNQIDPRTGHKNRDAKRMGRLSDQSLARMAPARTTRTPRGRGSR